MVYTLPVSSLHPVKLSGNNYHPVMKGISLFHLADVSGLIGKELLLDMARQGLKTLYSVDKIGVVLETLLDRGCWGCLGAQPHGLNLRQSNTDTLWSAREGNVFTPSM